jgi:uncharacterized sporulation protein YeaH/YhbH (DUF444 family)
MLSWDDISTACTCSKLLGLEDDYTRIVDLLSIFRNIDISLIKYETDVFKYTTTGSSPRITVKRELFSKLKRIRKFNYPEMEMLIHDYLKHIYEINIFVSPVK